MSIMILYMARFTKILPILMLPLILTLSGCLDSKLEINPDPSKLSSGTGATAGSTVTNVDQIDDDNTATGFGGGTHTGTTHNGTVLTLNASTSYAELDESWTPRWTNLLSYWKLNEPSWTPSAAGTVIDSQNFHHGTPIGNSNTTSTAKLGSFGGIFDGDGDYVSIAGSGSDYIFATFTVSLWTKSADFTANATAGDDALVGVWCASKGFIIWMPGNDLRFGDNTSSRVIWTNGRTKLEDNLWHHIVGVRDATTMRIYVDGVEKANAANGTLSYGCGGLTIGAYNGSGPIAAKIDDVAFWNAPLSADEVQLLYARQSAKYSGEMKSRVIDSQNAGSSWTNLDWITSLPFGKELPDGGGAANSESSADYSSLASSTLMQDLVGLWHLNGDLIDKSGNGFNASAVGGATTTSPGKFDKAAYYDGDNDSHSLGTLGTTFQTSWTASLWAKWDQFDPDNVGWTFVMAKPFTSNAPPYYQFDITESDGIVRAAVWNNALGYYMSGATPSALKTNRWYHIAVSIDVSAPSLNFYVDGELIQSVAASNGTYVNYATSVSLGENPIIGNGAYDMKGSVDEVAIWSRALSSSEILQLYRRGANRIKYQVRTCSASNCSDQDALTGDGWMGPGGNYLTYFSELYNNSSVTSSCATPQECFASELTLAGSVQKEKPSIPFNAFGADGVSVPNNRYFQYRVIMESDDENTACSGGTATCMPELKSVEIGPGHSY